MVKYLMQNSLMQGYHEAIRIFFSYLFISPFINIKGIDGSSHCTMSSLQYCPYDPLELVFLVVKDKKTECLLIT